MRIPARKKAQFSTDLGIECADIEEAHRVLDTLPLVGEGLIRFEVIPLVPYPGFEQLFEK